MRKKSTNPEEKPQKQAEKMRRKTVVAARKKDHEFKKAENIQPWAIKTDFEEDFDE